MDPLDHVRVGLDSATCAVCDGPVPSGSTRLLARRDGLAVLQVDCEACGSTTLSFLVAGDDNQGTPGTTLGPLTSDDVLDMHLFLRGWHGGLAELVDRATGSDVR